MPEHGRWRPTLWQRLGRVAYWLAVPGLFVYFRIGSRTRALVVAEEHVLLVQAWMSDGRWSLPGGGLHRREQPLAGVIRETAEESGLTLRPEQCTVLSSERFIDGWRKYYCHFFAATLDRRTVLQKQRGEIVAAQWFPVGELSRLPHRAEVDRALELLVHSA